ncbi:DUF6146 family protein [Tenacibaculum sp. SG-28]|uniref:DUF6146 family protein n=1 Tax=Tenacibaculum sp. SG-28 TaxID=754426 RepID=UPI000CF39548|nr:DUF6146 family protein [Tenacibaculum sp. SG-28]PQJ22846.1 hypothetical protein BSU00_00630 [Tenacibaculum sp. SG-28]
MNFSKYMVPIIIFSCIVYACSTSNRYNSSSGKDEPVVIANDSLEYEIIIMDVGFNTYLVSNARPVGYYSQSYLESRNRLYTTEWNIRVLNPSRYNPNIYNNSIDYNPNVDYGYDVNYKLFNYFKFVEQKYRIKIR